MGKFAGKLTPHQMYFLDMHPGYTYDPETWALRWTDARGARHYMKTRLRGILYREPRVPVGSVLSSGPVDREEALAASLPGILEWLVDHGFTVDDYFDGVMEVDGRPEPR